MVEFELLGTARGGTVGNVESVPAPTAARFSAEGLETGSAAATACGVALALGSSGRELAAWAVSLPVDQGVHHAHCGPD